MKQRSSLVYVTLLALLAVLVLALQPAVAVAAPPQCQRTKHLDNVMNDRILQARQFHIDEAGTGDLAYHGRGRNAYASLGLEQDLSGAYNAARITEVDTTLPPEARTRCWQPDARFDVIAEFKIRFAQAEKPFGLTETVFLWNSPLGGDQPLPVTSVGISRSESFPGYNANVSQNLTFEPFAFDHLEVVPMPQWLDPTEWHTVRITLGVHDVQIEVRQGGGYETVISTTLPEPVEPLAFELSVDNEAFPGLTVPVSVPDTLYVDSIDIRYKNVRRR
jgi:hypothetical protein